MSIVLYAASWVNCKVYATQQLLIVCDNIFSISTSNSNNRAGFLVWGNSLFYASVIPRMLDCIFMWKRQLAYFLLWFLNHKLREDEEICHNSCKSKAILENRLNSLQYFSHLKRCTSWRYVEISAMEISVIPESEHHTRLWFLWWVSDCSHVRKKRKKCKLPQLSAVWDLSSSISDFNRSSASCSADICMSRTFCHHPTDNKNSHRLK